MPFREVVQEIASTAQRRAALTLSVALLVGIAVVLPYASEPLVPLPHISGMYGAAAAMINLATFWLLISSPSQPRSHSIIAAAYLYAGLMAVLHVLTFPGAVLPDRALLGSLHAVSWLFIAWRAGFACFIIWAALSAMQPSKEPRTFTYWPPLVAPVAAVLAGFGSQWTDAAATVNQGGRQAFGLFSVYGSYSAAVLAVLAVVLIGLRGLHRRSIFIWLVVVLTAEAGGVWLSTYSGSRYTLAWYAVRVEGLIASSVVLVLLAHHFRRVQRGLADTVTKLLRRTEELQAAVHQRERAEQKLAQAEKLRMVGQLGAGLAHDLNNILQVVTGRLSILQRRVGAAADADVAAIRRSVAKAEALTRQLSLLSARRALVARPLDTRVELERIADNVRQLLDARHTVELHAEPNLGRVAVDGLELEIALTNLVTNARDAMPAGGVIRISAEAGEDPRLGAVCVLRVTDDGEGMSAEVIDRIFEPFFTTKPQGKGSGLGMPQVAAFIEASGGAIRVDSVPGQGTTICLMIPSRQVADAAQENALQGDAVVTAGKVILLVDDNHDVREATQQLLESSGFVVKAVDSGEEALQLLSRGFDPDILVSDIVMPQGMNGVKLVREVRRVRPLIRPVLVTGHSDVAQVATDEGFPVIAKPYDLPTLLQAVLSH